MGPSYLERAREWLDERRNGFAEDGDDELLAQLLEQVAGEARRAAYEDEVMVTAVFAEHEMKRTMAYLAEAHGSRREGR